jgi:O-antigen ligase
MAVASPWAVGGAPDWVFRTLTITSIGGSFLALIIEYRRGNGLFLPRPLWPLWGLLLLGTLQLVPLSSWVLKAVAPGAASVWYPSTPAAAVVLGAGPRPISVHPAATSEAVLWGVGLVSLLSLAIPALQAPRWRRRVLTLVVIGGVLLATYAVIARLFFGPLLFGRFPVPTTSPLGPFVSKNHFAGYIAMVTLVALGVASSLASHASRGTTALSWTRGRRANRTLLAFGASGMLGLATLFSQSRGGAVALVTGALAFFLLRLHQRTKARSGKALLARVVLVAGVFALLLAVLPREPRQRLAGLLGPPDLSSQYRLALHCDAFRAFVASPFVGQGLGAFEDTLPRFKSTAGELRVEHAENDYLELLVEAGVGGGILAGLGLVMMFRVIWALPWTRRGRERSEDELAGVFAALISVLVHSLFDFNLRLAASGTLSVLLLATVLASDRVETPRLSLRATPWALFGLGLTLLVASLKPVLDRPSQQAIRVAVSSPRPGGTRVRLAESALIGHLQRHPADAESWARLAWLRSIQGRIPEAAALALYASQLDPQRVTLQEYSNRLAVQSDASGKPTVQELNASRPLRMGAPGLRGATSGRAVCR